MVFNCYQYCYTTTATGEDYSPMYIHSIKLNSVSWVPEQFIFYNFTNKQYDKDSLVGAILLDFYVEAHYLFGREAIFFSLKPC